MGPEALPCPLPLTAAAGSCETRGRIPERAQLGPQDPGGAQHTALPPHESGRLQLGPLPSHTGSCRVPAPQTTAPLSPHMAECSARAGDTWMAGAQVVGPCLGHTLLE